MTKLARPPAAALRPFVDLLWASGSAVAAPATPGREGVLPTGATHIVLRPDDHPLRLFAGPDHGDDSEGRVVGSSVIGGARAAPYFKAIAGPVPTVGIMLRPGAVELLLGTPAGELAGTHTRLDDVWKRAELAELRERLAGVPTLAGRLAVVEAFLARRLPRVRGVDPLVARALSRFRAGIGVADVVVETGCSHRHFVRTFEGAVGLTPKRYCRVLRFRRVLEHCRANAEASWATIAADAGYSDQAHLSREFRALAGVTPGRYRRLAPAAPHHLPIRGSDSFRNGAAGGGWTADVPRQRLPLGRPPIPKRR